MISVRVFCMAVLICMASAAQAPIAQVATGLKTPFTFVAFGDTRFTDPAEKVASNAKARQLIVKGIADAHPAFISVGGDITWNGNEAGDWKVYDQETAIWQEQRIPVYPILGNHDLHGPEAVALANYFQRYPFLDHHRFYSVRAERMLMLDLDSALEETTGPQGNWLNAQLDALPADVDFVFIVMHHPPYTSSTDAKPMGGGHSVRSREMDLAAQLEARQARTRARIIVLSSHVHNYERHERGGVTYFVTGGGGAHAYPIERAPGDPIQDHRVNYHVLLVKIEPGLATVTMRRLGLEAAVPEWTTEDTVRIIAPANPAAAQAPGPGLPGERIASEDPQVRDFHAVPLKLPGLRLFRSGSPLRDLKGQPQDARRQALADKALAHLRDLGIATIVSLEDPAEGEGNPLVRMERKAAEGAGITFLSEPMVNERLKDMGPEAIRSWLQAVERDIRNSASRGAVLVHCAAGHDRTGIAVAYLRITVDGWTADQAIQEMRDLGHNWPKFSTDGGRSSWHEAFLRSTTAPTLVSRSK